MQHKHFSHRIGLTKTIAYAKVITAVAVGAWFTFQPLVSPAQEKPPQEKMAMAPKGKVPYAKLTGGRLIVGKEGTYLDVYGAMQGMSGNCNASEKDVKCKIDNDSYMVVKTNGQDSIEAAYTRCYVFERGVLAVYFDKGGAVSGYSAMPADGKYLGASIATFDKKAIFIVFSKSVLCFTDSGGSTVPFFKEAKTASLLLVGANMARLLTSVCVADLSSDGKYVMTTSKIF
jgi:hypothetical protein